MCPECVYSGIKLEGGGGGNSRAGGGEGGEEIVEELWMGVSHLKQNGMELRCE